MEEGEHCVFRPKILLVSILSIGKKGKLCGSNAGKMTALHIDAFWGERVRKTFILHCATSLSSVWGWAHVQTKPQALSFLFWGWNTRKRGDEEHMGALSTIWPCVAHIALTFSGKTWRRRFLPCISSGPLRRFFR